MKRKFQYLLFGALLALLVLAGCNSDTAQSSSPEKQEEPKQDTLTIGLDADPSTLDPHRSSSAVDRQVLQAIFSKLVDIDEDANIVPELAEDWKISEDGTVYTFNLKEGVTFHDGTPFNAQAVAFNFERMLDPDFGSPRKSELELIENIKVVDALTLEITLSEPYSPFLSVLSDRAGMMVSPTAVKELGDDFANQPVGAGPYKFVDRVLQSNVDVTRFEDFWGEPAKIENVVYQTLTDENIRVTNLISGDVDIVNKIGFKDINRLKEDANIEVSTVDGLGFQGIHLNMSKEPFGNKKIREAINIGVNRQALTQVVFRGGAVPAVSPFPPSTWANNPDMEVPAGDVEKAKQLVAESGIENPSFTLKLAPSATEKQTAEMLQAMLKEIGITMDIEMVEHGALIDDEFSGNFEAVRLGWSGRTDPDGNAYNYFMSDGIYNFTGVNNPEIDRLLQTARTSSNQDNRKKMYQEFSELLFEESAYIFLYHEQDIKAMKNNVKGYSHTPDGMIRPETLYFE